MRVYAAILTACWAVAAVAQSNDGSNLETMPSIITGTAANTPFNPSTFRTAPGPALPPSATSFFPSDSSSIAARTTLISAQPPPSSNASSSAQLTAAPNATASESVVTSTVDGSVTTVTVTSTAKPSSAASRRIARVGTDAALGVGVAMLLGVAGGVLLV